ncbi:UDP-3-O-(3-hydroxymyristoyl)glucosamine N-acyltransferase [Hymenobacter sp. UV11]|uniref:UDP-3-O-(3-hydroxymyristoyl)glucosamine N-acyltransferase n=1 Tax=Hymenobacter sp. UV11 TaxID=1849735 RepID=UPI00106137A6|nr:UDP-3-O-(3-hydroxymyristoyl)glucosamine N-acyltransferase [Hymenobacter sp. UV11]TDN40409.1 UDP-3-O-(3-hydroxymyristoyl)glucosamine N-acyltransferase [Hymenobacter sp. UV11]TFZ66588.1 UDP-3-O-(3-hydroxymyristoyl)glucosamine N-acyltransferase [Hymenobacter sp. UV11]
MKFTVAQIAQVVGGTVEGDAEATVSSLAKIEEAGPGALAFLANAKYEPFLYSTGATAVIVSPDLPLRQAVAATLVRVADPYSAFTKLLEFYAQATRMGKRGVEQPSYLAESATIGAGHYRGAFSYIGDNCVLGENVLIFPHAYIGDRVRIGDNSIIHAGAKIYADTVIGRRCVIKAGAVVGTDGFGFAPQPDGSYKAIPQIGNVVLEDDVSIGANTTIDCATMGSTLIRQGTKIDNLVQVAHNNEIGRHTVIAAQSGLSGSVKIGDFCVLAGQVGIVGHISVASHTTLAAKTGLQKSVREEGQVLQGYPAFSLRENQRSAVIYRRLPELERRLATLEKNQPAPDKP